MNHYPIRKATAQDVSALFDLIKELAQYEKAIYEVENTPEQLLADGFGDRPLFGAYVAEHESAVVGAAFYYFRYSTWKGKRLFLEDLIVTEAHRRQGVGQRLFEQMVAVAQAEQCNGLSLQVLDWNQPALDFYQKQFLTTDPAWINGHLSAEQMREWKFRYVDPTPFSGPGNSR